MKRIILIFSIFFFCTNLYSQIYLIGPSIHYNINKHEGNKWSWGIEFSYWNWEKTKVPAIGICMGLEFEKEKKRIYSDFQVGTLMGGTIGYVYEFARDYSKGGIQLSGWTAAYGGIDIRYRRINKLNFYVPGIFAKAPLYQKLPSI